MENDTSSMEASQHESSQEITQESSQHPSQDCISFRTRNRLKKKAKTNNNNEDSDQEIVFTPIEKTEKRQRLKQYESIDLSDFIVSDEEEQEPRGTQYTLKELLEMDDNLGPSLKRNRSVASPPNMIPFRIPMEAISPLSEEHKKFIEEDVKIKKDYEDMINMTRSEWGESPFYIRLYETVIIPAMRMGRESRKSSNDELLDMISSNRVVFNDSIPIKVEEEKCDGCGIKHRALKYTFFTFSEDGKQEGLLKMGSHCGEKTRCVIEIYRFLNSIPFVPLEQREWFYNIHAMINYWAFSTLQVISDPTWRVVEKEENDDEST